jgi:3-dehydroquinate synthase
MSIHLQRITVRFEYPVYFTRDAFDAGNTDLVDALAWREPTRRHRALVVIDGGVASAWPSLSRDVVRYFDAHSGRLQLAAEPLVLDGGEAVKNDPAVANALQNRLHDVALDRHSFVVVIGGGAILDMAGYVAATVHRGIRVVRMPTSVLAQADSGVGVKNGINAFGKKNFVGTFAPPFAVVNDGRFLETLSRRDKIGGIAEAVKVALIRDAAFFGWLSEHAELLAACDADELQALVRRTAELHLAHIATAGDPFELGSARPLDFGHWAAHKLESLTKNRLRHGEAVAIGVALDTIYSAAAGLCDRGTAESVLGVLHRVGLRPWDEALTWTAPDGRFLVLDGLNEFREHLGGDLTITLLREVGKALEVHEMREDLVRHAIEQLRRHESASIGPR